MASFGSLTGSAPLARCRRPRGRVLGRAAGAAASEDYTTNRYHKPQDEYRDDWVWDGAVEDLTLNYRIGRDLADGTAWPNWYPGAEFRAARDASRK